MKLFMLNNDKWNFINQLTWQNRFRVKYINHLNRHNPFYSIIEWLLKVTEQMKLFESERIEMKIWHKKSNPIIKNNIDKFLIVKKKTKNIEIGYYNSNDGNWYKGKAFCGERFVGYIDIIEIEAWTRLPKYKQ